MNRRNFLVSALTLLAAPLFGIAAGSQLARIHRLEGGRWERVRSVRIRWVRVRMIQLRKGDRFTHSQWPGRLCTAMEDARPDPTGTAVVQASIEAVNA